MTKVHYEETDLEKKSTKEEKQNESFAESFAAKANVILGQWGSIPTDRNCNSDENVDVDVDAGGDGDDDTHMTVMITTMKMAMIPIVIVIVIVIKIVIGLVMLGNTGAMPLQ